MVDVLRYLEKKRARLNAMDVIVFEKGANSLKWVHTDKEGYLKREEVKLPHSNAVQLLADQLAEDVVTDAKQKVACIYTEYSRVLLTYDELIKCESNDKLCFSSLQLLYKKDCKPFLYFISVMATFPHKPKYWKVPLTSAAHFPEQPLNTLEAPYKKHIFTTTKLLLPLIAAKTKNRAKHLKLAFAVQDNGVDAVKTWYVDCGSVRSAGESKGLNGWMLVLRKSEAGKLCPKAATQGFPVRWENFRKTWYCKHARSRNRKDGTVSLQRSYKDAEIKLSYTSLDAFNKRGNKSDKELIKIVGIGKHPKNAKKREETSSKVTDYTTQSNSKWSYHRKRRQAYFFANTNSLFRAKHHWQPKDHLDLVCQGKPFTVRHKATTSHCTGGRHGQSEYFAMNVCRAVRRSRTADASRNESKELSPKNLAKPKFDVLVTKSRKKVYSKHQIKPFALYN